jgi:hypothetical protein
MLGHGRRVAATTIALLLTATAAHAVAPRFGARAADQGLVAMTPLRAPLRGHVLVDHGVRTAAWDRFVAAAGGRWEASWDRATGVPSRIWGEGIAAPGASADPAIAIAAAQRVIAAHLDLLAPGAAPADLIVVSNHWDGEMRSIGFAQHARGLRVEGGQVSVRIKHDRIFVLSSQALPHVTAAIAPPARKLADATLTDRSRAALDAAVGLPASATAGTPGAAVVLPLVAADAVLGYRVVAPIAIDAGAAGAWTVFVDPATGEVVARRPELSYVSAGNVLYDVVERWTGRPRILVPAAAADVEVNGVTTRTTTTGGIIWTASTPATVVTYPHGDMATMTDQTGTVVSGQITVPPSGQGVWSGVGDERTDAQINAYVHAGIVREFVKDNFARDLPFVYEPVQVVVNIDDECNAYSNGTAIHFFLASPAGSMVSCENTALLADVVYHEYGHSMHRHAVIDGVGAFDGAMSEGLSDFLAAAITGDPAMGRGFFHGDDPLRHIDPADTEYIWPRDISEIHYTGLIFAGTYWDLRKQLITDLGEEAGAALTLKLFYAAVQRATDIPSSLVEALAADDNDGNLANGTPHECTIRAVFGAHGLRTISGHVEAPGAVVATAGNMVAPVQIRITGLSSTCGDEVQDVRLVWRPGLGATPAAGSAIAVQNGDTWSADLPLPNDGGRVDYRVDIEFANPAPPPAPATIVVTLPDNPSDTYYQMFQGETVPLYCTDFETDPFAEGWTIGGTSDWPHQNFEWGPPSRQYSASDPDRAYSGDYVLGTGLGYDYGDDKSVSVHLPPIDVGQYSDVLVQYRRWLTVEDGFYDHALIQANGTTAWTNVDSMQGESSSTHHIDREWRFHTVGLSARFAGPILDLSFRLDSDQGLHFGGWAIDDLCVVANPNSICGDGTRTGTEECDDGTGNAQAPDACRPNCKVATCGDGIVDSGEECEPGIDPECLTACLIDPAQDGGCCGAGGGPSGFLFALGVGALLLRPRRRSAA